MPSAEENKRYALKVERFTVPPMSSGLILNQPLFTVERRLTNNTVYSVQHPITGVYTTVGAATLNVPAIFSPINVRTTSELMYQMNMFFRKMLLSSVTSTVDYAVGAEVFVVQDIFEPQDFEITDWYEFQDTEDGIPVQRALEAVYRADGRIGIKFSEEAIPMFVIHLTSEGKRILGWDMDYLFVDENNDFKEEYLTLAPGGLPGALQYNVRQDVPANPASVIGVLNNNIFNHGHYRHEIVITTSLPLRTFLECDHRSALFKHQLVSYRYPSEPVISQYEGTLYRVLKDERKNRYLFEQSTKTHNEFLMTGTQLQNFHIRLMQRNYKWDDTFQRFNISEIPYSLPEESLWTIQFVITPLR